MTTFQNTFSFGAETVDAKVVFADLPQAAQDFVIQYGIRQYLSDGAAVSKDECDTEEERNKLKADNVAGRIRKLYEGTMSIRGGGTRTTDPVAKIKRDLATEILKAHWKQNNLPILKGQELTDKIANFWERNGDKPSVKKELDKRVKALQKDTLGDLDI